MSATLLAMVLAAGAGFEVNDAAETGIAVYPGAKPEKRSGDSPALTLGFWGGSKDFRLALAKYISADEPARVAEFYRTELAKLGRVVDCSADSGDELCGDASLEDGVIELRVGKT
jgi:hypothetical protein